MKKYYISSEHSGAPLSGACESNGIVFVSGQIHADQNWKLIGETIEERFAITMQRVEDILAEAELTKKDIIRVNIYLTDISELKDLNGAYVKYFNIHPMPARTAMEVKSLPLGASLEIDVIAGR